MRELSATISPNPYYWSPEGRTTLTRLFDTLGHIDVQFIKLLLSYPVPAYHDVDLFQFIDSRSLAQLRTGKTILIFDSVFEGFSPEATPIAKALYNSCLRHDIDPKKIFFFTGNLVDNSAEINIIPIFTLDYFEDWKHSLVGTPKKAKRRFERNFDKFILSLSRRNRSHRVIAHCILANSELAQFSIISQDKLEHDIDVRNAGVTSDQYKKFKDSLPLIADKDQFDVNEPFNALPELHSRTAFSIVNETLADNVNNTTLFFSEKFLKPIVNFQPMLIYGHQGINKKLNLLGFRSYESYFDLSFDDEPDDVLRYKKLLESAAKTVKELELLSREEQIEWRFKNTKLLKYNYNVFVENFHSKQQLRVFEAALSAINF